MPRAIVVSFAALTIVWTLALFTAPVAGQSVRAAAGRPASRYHTA